MESIEIVGQIRCGFRMEDGDAQNLEPPKSLEGLKSLDLQHPEGPKVSSLISLHNLRYVNLPS